MKKRRRRHYRKNPGSSTGAIVGAVTGIVAVWFVDRNVIGIGGAPAVAPGGLLGAGAGYKLA